VRAYRKGPEVNLNPTGIAVAKVYRGTKGEKWNDRDGKKHENKKGHKIVGVQPREGRSCTGRKGGR